MERFMGFALVAILGLLVVIMIGVYMSQPSDPRVRAMQQRNADRDACERQVGGRSDNPDLPLPQRLAYVKCMHDLGYQYR